MIHDVRTLWKGRARPSAISYATVREFCEYADACPSLFGGCQDLKDAQRPWAVKAILTSLPPGSSLVEIGGGEPTVAQALVDLGYRVTVVDPYDGSGNGPVEFERYRQNHPRVRLVRSLFELDCPFEAASFDCVYSVSVIEHIAIPHLPSLFAAMRKFLKPGGMSIHCVDVVIKGWMTEAMRDTARTIIRLQHELTGQEELENEDVYDALVGSMEADLETFFLSAHGHNMWRNKEPYGQYAFRRVASLQLCGHALLSEGDAAPASLQNDALVGNLERGPEDAIAASYLDLPTEPPTAPVFTVQAWIAGNEPLRAARVPVQPPIPLAITRRPDVERLHPDHQHICGITGSAPASALRDNSLEIEFLWGEAWKSHTFHLPGKPVVIEIPKPSWKAHRLELRQWLDQLDLVAQCTGTRGASHSQMEFNKRFMKTMLALAAEVERLTQPFQLRTDLADEIRRRAQSIQGEAQKTPPNKSSQHEWNTGAVQKAGALYDTCLLFEAEAQPPHTDAVSSRSRKLEKTVQEVQSKMARGRRGIKKWFGPLFVDQRAINTGLHRIVVELHKKVSRLNQRIADHPAATLNDR